MFRFAFCIVLLFSAVGYSQGCECSCDHSNLSRESTREGGNRIITLTNKKTYRYLSGKVLAGDEPLSGVLVEIFDKPEWIIKGESKAPAEQKRIVACMTSDDGTFCFRDLPRGNYELRASKDISWNPFHMYVTVEPASNKAVNDLIEVRMSLGT